MLRRIKVHPFSDKQIALLQTFADQAVIAIAAMSKCFEEVEGQDSSDLAETLQQQTATSEVLQVISSSQGDLDIPCSTRCWRTPREFAAPNSDR